MNNETIVARVTCTSPYNYVVQFGNATVWLQRTVDGRLIGPLQHSALTAIHNAIKSEPNAMRWTVRFP